MVPPSARELWLFFVRFSTPSPARPGCHDRWVVSRADHLRVHIREHVIVYLYF
jgi:hypothetical protein